MAYGEQQMLVAFSQADCCLLSILFDLQCVHFFGDYIDNKTHELEDWKSLKIFTQLASREDGKNKRNAL